MRKHQDGDVVTVRSWKSMENEYGTNDYGSINMTPFFINEMKYMCGKTIRLNFISYICNWYEYDGFSLDDWMFEE